MIIEFYGLPGAGKTTMAKKISTQLGIPIIKIERKIELLFYNILYFLIHPISFLQGLQYIFRYSKNWQLFYYKFLNSFLHNNAKYQKARRHRHAILDQGHFQNIISVLEEVVNEDDLIKYIHIFPKPDLLVVFQISEEIRRSQLLERGFSAREQFGNEYLEQWREITEENNALLNKILFRLPLNFVVIQSDKDIEKIFLYFKSSKI